jgi:hypothetical protein
LKYEEEEEEKINMMWKIILQREMCSPDARIFPKLKVLRRLREVLFHQRSLDFHVAVRVVL